MIKLIALTFLTITLASLPVSSSGKATTVLPKVTMAERNHSVGQLRRASRRKPVRRGAIGAGGAGTYGRRTRRGAIGAGGAGVYKVKAKGRSRKGRVVKRKPVWDDTDIAH